MFDRYFDHNATSPMRHEVKDHLRKNLDFLGNPSSVHQQGRKVRSLMEAERSAIGTTLGIDPRRLIFTSGATEANNMVLKGLKDYPVYVSAVEHDSVRDVRKDAGVLRVTKDGVLDLNYLEDVLKHHQGDKVLISVMAANNETGAIQPVEQVQKLCKKYGALSHCDGVQGLRKLDIKWSDFDFSSFSGHKLGALSGVGVLVINPAIALEKIVIGGGQERSYRAGTENILGILSLGRAFETFSTGNAKNLRDRIEAEIQTYCPDARIISKNVDRLDNTSLIAMPSMVSETQLMNFDLSGFCLSAGSACSSGKVKKSPVLTAMGIDNELAKCTLRVSLGWTNTPEAVSDFIKIWRNLYERCH